ncbi:MAG: hypothetical protein EOP04_22235, partial [Proteobacteria bacterium]
MVGGPSVLVSTKPRFVLTAEFLQEGDESSSPFAPASPAGKFLARHERDFRGYRLHFDDPHQGAGGLGASSAQWALLYALKYGVHDQPDWAAMLEEYRQCAWNGEGVAPSGADVVSQIHGGITCFDGREFQAQSLQWNFPNLSFTLVRT